MKKLALILAFLVIPCAAFGLEMLNDNAMDQVTGQSGVSIAVDDVQLFINIEKLAWIDCDGYTSQASWYGTCTGAAGALAISNFQIDVLNINAIVSSTAGDDQGTQTSADNGAMQLYSTRCGMIPLFYDYGTGDAVGCYLGSTTAGAMGLGLNNYLSPSASRPGFFQARHLTIDATDDLPALTAGLQNNSAAAAAAGLSMGGVLIGIPTLEIYINELSLTPIYDGDVNGHSSFAINDDNNGFGAAVGLNDPSFGTIVLEGITFTTLSGWLEIAPH